MKRGSCQNSPPRGAGPRCYWIRVWAVVSAVLWFPGAIRSLSIAAKVKEQDIKKQLGGTSPEELG